MAIWLCYAKLRQHTDSTLDQFDVATKSLGRQLRIFSSKVCSAFVTRGNPKEQAARTWRRASKPTKPTSSKSGPKQRKFNLDTYKLHALGDYVNNIRLYGTTDSFSSQIVRQVPKFLLCQTNIKTKRVSANTAASNGFMLEQTKINLPVNAPVTSAGNASSAVLRKVDQKRKKSKAALEFADSEPLPFASPKAYHQISESNRYDINLSQWLVDDLAVKVRTIYSLP